MADIRRPAAGAVFGLVLAVFGVLLFLDRTSIFDAFRLVALFWPTVLVAAGVWKLVAPGSGASRITGAGLAVFGGWWLADELGWARFELGLAWPVLLVFFGVALAWRGLMGSGARRGPAGDEVAPDGSTVDAVAILGAAKRSSGAANFRGGDLFAFLGGLEIDLRSASIVESPAVIDAFAFWGGIEIKVPPRWRVEVQGIPVLAGFEDSTRRGDAEPSGERLIVKGFAVMGGVEVKS